MTKKELPKRNDKAQDLKVLRANGNYFVESAEGMVLYKVCLQPPFTVTVFNRPL